MRDEKFGVLSFEFRVAREGCGMKVLSFPYSLLPTPYSLLPSFPCSPCPLTR